MLESTGIPTPAQIDAAFPSDERLSRGRVAIIECFQEIPCNPCATSCPVNAIAPFVQITDLPAIDHDKCTGCLACISKCPGLAIMVVDFAHSDTHAVLHVPHEFLPLPKVGDVVEATDRAGQPIGPAEVISVRNTARMDKTPVVGIAVDKSIARQARGFRITTPEETIVCRCADITREGLIALIAAGNHSIDELKRAARLGMGSCAGRGCINVAMSIIAARLGIPTAEQSPGEFRPYTKPVKLGAIAAGGHDE